MKKEVWNEFKAEKFLSKYLDVAKSQLVRKFEEIKIKAPCVLKIVSDDALHKTEIGGVKIVKEQKNLESDFNSLLDIARKKKLKIEGILVHEFVSGQELIIGINKDEVFGHVIVFGVGGIFTEVLKDTSMRKCPITRKDAEEMIFELRAKKIFEGFRGRKLNLEVLKKTLVKVSEIPLKNKAIVEMDINPYILNEKTGKVADARIVLAK